MQVDWSTQARHPASRQPAPRRASPRRANPRRALAARARRRSCTRTTWASSSVGGRAPSTSRRRRRWRAASWATSTRGTTRPRSAPAGVHHRRRREPRLARKQRPWPESARGQRVRPRPERAPAAKECARGQRERESAHRRRAPPHARCRASQSRLAQWQSVEQLLRRVARRVLQGHGVARACAARRARARQGQRAPHPSQGPGRRGRPDAVGLGQVTARRRRDDRRPRGGRRL